MGRIKTLSNSPRYTAVCHDVIQLLTCCYSVVMQQVECRTCDQAVMLSRLCLFIVIPCSITNGGGVMVQQVECRTCDQEVVG